MCPDNKLPSGGVKQLYRFAEILQKNGYDAYILHNKKNFKVTWFQHSIKIVYSNFIFKVVNNRLHNKKPNVFSKIKLSYYKNTSHKLEPNALLIIPEIYTRGIIDLPHGIDKVIFNQNCYYTFNGYHSQDNIIYNPFTNPEVKGNIVASLDAMEYLQHTFPTSETCKIRLGIDHTIFNFSKAKKKQIAYMPRKLTEDVNQVISILNLRQNLTDWEFVAIDGLDESGVSSIMKESAIFLSFNHREGFGLPPAEAMACGCLVIGYQGGGGKEYFKNEFSYPIEDGNIIQFAKTVEDVIAKHSFEDIVYKGQIASDFILKNYSLENEQKDVLEVIKKFI